MQAGSFTLHYLPNSLGRPRLGVAISRHATGSAVARNRVRRVLRSRFLRCAARLPAKDYVVTASSVNLRDAGLALPFEQALEELARGGGDG